jgi:hypothetical protein
MGTQCESAGSVVELDHRSSGRLDDAVLRAELRSLCSRGGEQSEHRVHRARSLRCRLGLHRMRYSGVTLGQRIERCDRCRFRRPAA